MSKLGTYLVSILSISSLSLNESFADSLGSLELLQKQVSQSISDSKKAGAALIGLEYVRGKFYPTSDGKPALWEVLSGDFSSKPRVTVKRTLENVDQAGVARWLLREEKNPEGICIPLPTTQISVKAATDCLSRNTELVIDESGLAGLEQISALTPEDEQQGVVGELILSEEEREQFMTDPNFKPQRLTSGIQSLKLAFKKIIEEKEKRFLEVEVGGVLARIQLPSLQELQYVESGTGRILSVALPPIENRNLASISCPVVSHQVKGCTGLGSASCGAPRPELAQPTQHFCKPQPQVGAFGNFIVSIFGKGARKFFLSNSGQTFSSAGAVPPLIDEKFVSVVGPHKGVWFALRSDGALFRTTDIESSEKFQKVPCVSLERAEALVPEAGDNLSCL